MVVERLKSCENIVALAQELGLHRRLLYNPTTMSQPTEQMPGPRNHCRNPNGCGRPNGGASIDSEIVQNYGEPQPSSAEIGLIIIEARAGSKFTDACVLAPLRVAVIVAFVAAATAEEPIAKVV